VPARSSWVTVLAVSASTSTGSRCWSIASESGLDAAGISDVRGYRAGGVARVPEVLGEGLEGVGAPAEQGEVVALGAEALGEAFAKTRADAGDDGSSSHGAGSKARVADKVRGLR